MLASNIMGIGYNGSSRIDNVRLFATRCHFGHSIGVIVVRRPITIEMYCFRIVWTVGHALYYLIHVSRLQAEISIRC